jgi:ethanolamine ammonia-lyase small subunit
MPQPCVNYWVRQEFVVSVPRDLPPDPWARFRAFTRARIGLDRCGDAMSTQALLQFQLDHAHARDAVNGVVDFSAVAMQIGGDRPILHVHSAAADRATYLRRPDLGRRLDDSSRALLASNQAREKWDVALIVADGLSSAAVNDHAATTLDACLRRLAGWKVAPIVLAAQARVALGDEICVLLNANLCAVLIGERPGLSVANSLGIYLTWQPRIGHRDADRNCISNIHADGLTYEHAAEKLYWLLSEATRRQVSGIALKEDARTGVSFLTPPNLSLSRPENEA